VSNEPSGFLISPARVIRALARMAGLLFLAHGAALLTAQQYPHKLTRELAALFDLTAERNIPTLFSACLFLLNAFLFWVVGKSGQGKGIRQLGQGCCLLFLFLSVDESAGLHERLMGPVRELLHASGPFYFAWVVPYGIAVIALTVGVFPVWRRLEPGIRAGFLRAAVTFVFGALGMEMAGAALFQYLGGLQSEFVMQPLYQTVSGVEELLELSGLILLTHTLLSFLQMQHPTLALIMRDSPELPTMVSRRRTLPGGLPDSPAASL
jgi:hypothetical protein